MPAPGSATPDPATGDRTPYRWLTTGWALLTAVIGLVLAAGALHVAGNPDAPFSLGAVPHFAYAGIGAAYVVAGVLALALTVHRIDWRPGGRALAAATLVAVPVGGAILVYVDVQRQGAAAVLTAAEVTGRVLALGLFAPVAGALAMGYHRDVADEVFTVVALAFVVGLATVVVGIRQSGPLDVAVLAVFVAANVVVDAVAAYPVYRLGRRIGSTDG